MVPFSSSRMRSLLTTVVFSFVGCLLLLYPYLKTSSSFLNVPDKTIKMANSEYGRLEEVEELENLPSSRSLVDEFLDKDSRARNFFFPDEGNAIDPRKKNGNLDYYPGRIWLDTNGNPIQAHGGGILFDEMSQRYFWYGEYKDGPTYKAQGKGTARVDIIGVGCYSSRDLWTWKNEGIVLKAGDNNNKTHDLHKSNVLERPKVIYNEKTGKYVMWMHIDSADYTKAAVGIAVSDAPTGPFRFLYSKRPHGFDSRDMTVFKDEDGTVYLYYSSLHNKEIHVGPLTEDYLDVRDIVSKVMVGQHREAPAVFKHRGKYYMITSGCSGWAPNEALAHVAESALGPWETIGNPCVGANKVFRVATFFGQSTFVLPMPGAPRGWFVFMADRWKPDDLRDSRYLWLPLFVDEETANKLPHNRPMKPQASIFWHGKWRIPTLDGK